MTSQKLYLFQKMQSASEWLKMLVKAKRLMDAVKLDGTKKDYPDWVEWLILKHRLVYYPSEKRWVLYNKQTLHDNDYLVREISDIVGMDETDFKIMYQVVQE